MLASMMGLTLTILKLFVCMSNTIHRAQGIESPKESTCNELVALILKGQHWAQCCIYLLLHVQQFPKC